MRSAVRRSGLYGAFLSPQIPLPETVNKEKCLPEGSKIQIRKCHSKELNSNRLRAACPVNIGFGEYILNPERLLC